MTGTPTPLRISILTMRFPQPSEAFAAVEVRSLAACGVDVRVHALRPGRALDGRLLHDAGIPADKVTQLRASGYVRGLALMLLEPVLALRTIGWLFASTLRKPAQLARCLVLLPRMFEIRRECRRFRPDVLHAFWGHFPAVAVQLCGQGVEPAPVRSISLGAYDLNYGLAPGNEVARSADVVWTHAHANEQRLNGLLGEPARAVVLQRGIDLGQLSRVEAARDPLQVLCVSRLEKDKGVDDCLRAFAAIADGVPGATLRVIGEGPDRARLEALAGELAIATRVGFTGAMPHSRVFAELARSGVFMLLSRSPSERLPNALKEAMASGCICIVTVTPGVEELLGPMRDPMVVAQGDWQGAAERLRAALLDPRRFAADVEVGKAHMLAHFDAMAVARERVRRWQAIRGQAVAGAK
jgi:glycosyltransferase involved in cell wall biosynthesis